MHRVRFSLWDTDIASKYNTAGTGVPFYKGSASPGGATRLSFGAPSVITRLAELPLANPDWLDSSAIQCTVNRWR